MIKPSSVKTPAQPPKYFPPQGFIARHKVKSGENWDELRKQYNRGNSWDIIIYNFETTVPEEVNWYLERYVGCQTTTTDKRNYRFTSKDVPGVLYIPPADWRPWQGPIDTTPNWETTQDTAAREAALNIFKDYRLGLVDFVWDGWPINRKVYDGVEKLIGQKRIGVDYDSSLNGKAAYDSDSNTLHFGFTSASSPEQAAIAVHEVTHAALDMLRASGLNMLQSEAIAYLAQCIYYMRRTTFHLKGNPALKRASEIAADMIDRRRPLDDLMKLSLIEAVFKTPLYSGDRFRMAGYNGIP